MRTLSPLEIHHIHGAQAELDIFYFFAIVGIGMGVGLLNIYLRQPPKKEDLAHLTPQEAYQLGKVDGLNLCIR